MNERQVLDYRTVVEKEIAPGLSVRLSWQTDGNNYEVLQTWLPERPDMLPGGGIEQAAYVSALFELWTRTGYTREEWEQQSALTRHWLLLGKSVPECSRSTGHANCRGPARGIVV